MAYGAESTPNCKRSLGPIGYSDYQAAKAFRRAKPFPSDSRLIGVASSRFAHLDRATQRKPHAATIEHYRNSRLSYEGRGAGVVERGGLENRCVALRHRGFESHPLRHTSPRPVRGRLSHATIPIRDRVSVTPKSTGEANWRPESATTRPVIRRGAGAVERARLESV